MEVEMATSVIDFVFVFFTLVLVGCIVVIAFTCTAMAVNEFRDDLKERKEMERKESEERKEL